MTYFFDKFQKKIKLPEGTEVVWRISAYTVIENKGKILLVKPTYDKSLWTLPGGGIEPEESVKEGVERECYEESGYKIETDIETPIHVSESNFYDEDIFFHSVNMIFKSKLLSEDQDKNAIDVDEIAEMKWVPIEDINEENCHHIMYPSVEVIRRFSRGEASVSTSNPQD